MPRRSTARMTCVAKNCGYIYEKDVRLNVFRIPFGAGSDGQREKWIANMEVDANKLKMERRSAPRWGICEQHFLKKCCYDYEQGSRLRVGAVPTLLLDDKKQWRKVAPDYDALGEEHTREIKRGLELDHTYRSGDGTSTATISESPAKRRKVTEAQAAEALKAAKKDEAAQRAATTLKSELEKAKKQISDLKRQVHTQTLQLKRTEERLNRRDRKRDDLQYAVDKLKSLLGCCECGLKPDSEAELAKMLKRKKAKSTAADSAAQEAGKEGNGPPKPNLPTKVVCRNDLVVGLTWKQLFARVNSIAQESDDS